MNLDAETIALSQIQYLVRCVQTGIFTLSSLRVKHFAMNMFQVTSLNKKNYKSSITDCLNLVDKYGLESERHLLKILFAQSELATSGSARPTSPQLQVGGLLSYIPRATSHDPDLVFSFWPSTARAFSTDPILSRWSASLWNTFSHNQVGHGRRLNLFPWLPKIWDFLPWGI